MNFPTLPPEAAVAIAILNTAGLGLIAYLLVRGGLRIVEQIARDTRQTVDGNTRSVNRLVRMWALWLITERREIPQRVREEATEILEEARADPTRGNDGAGGAAGSS